MTANGQTLDFTSWATSNGFCFYLKLTYSCKYPGWKHPLNTCPSSTKDSVLPSSGTCTSVDCDCVAFFQQLYFAYSNTEPLWYSNYTPKTIKGYETTFTSSKGLITSLRGT